LEIGTGLSLIGAILFNLKGAKKNHGFDQLPHASFSIAQILIQAINKI
tara:strand:+ start:117 stop:260 length:144 start_codon:yes stop_codon:yes gene_type:complete